MKLKIFKRHFFNLKKEKMLKMLLRKLGEHCTAFKLIGYIDLNAPLRYTINVCAYV